jgi:hypothetical protein
LILDELPRIVAGGGDRQVAKVCAAALEEIATIGRSLGVSGIVATQKGTEQHWGSTMTRGNWLRGGATVMHRADDTQMVNAALQQLSLPLASLPKEPGWAWVASGIDSWPPTRGRVMWLPHRLDVEEGGHAAPHGTVEEWLASTVHPALHPDDAASLRLDEWDACHDGTGRRLPTAETVVVAEGVAVERPTLALVREPAQPVAVERVFAAVPSPPGWARKSEIAEAAQVSGRYCLEKLSTLTESGKIVRAGDGNDTRYQRRTA